MYNVFLCAATINRIINVDFNPKLAYTLNASYCKLYILEVSNEV